MLPPSASEQAGALPAIECGLTAIAVAVSFVWPLFGSELFRRIEATFSRFARRKGLAVLSVGLVALLLRLAVLPAFPIPKPFLPDDFSFLLAADTFAHGRLTNPTPVMWQHFESIHITLQPTYMSMYFPAQGLLLAASKVVFGQPWYGILISSALMCAAICWMLQAWLPPGWALFGGVLAVIRIGLFSYWVNTYSGAGPLLALGGALLLGSLPRLMKKPRLIYGLLAAAGVILLVLTRPFEGLLLSLPVAFALGRWAYGGQNRPRPLALIKLAFVPLALIVGALAWLGYYDYRVFGAPLILPYTVNRATYAMAPYFVWQPPRPEPAYRHHEMRSFYYDSEMPGFYEMHSRPLTFVLKTINKTWQAGGFFASFALLPPLIMLPHLFRDRRIRFLVVTVLFAAAGTTFMIYLIPHYLAPFTAAFYAIGIQGMRHLRLWAPEAKPVGKTIVRFAVIVCFLLAGVRLLAGPLMVKVPEWPAGNWAGMWFGPEPNGTERAEIAASLECLPGKQLAIVRYAHKRQPLNQWVYNSFDIDSSKVIWASEMDPAHDRELLNYYRDRKVWLIEPDAIPARASPFPLLHASTGAAH